MLFCSNGDWTDVGRMARGVAKDNLVGLTVGLFGLVLIVGLAAALVPAVQDALRLAFYAVVAGVVGLVMWTNV